MPIRDLAIFRSRTSGRSGPVEVTRQLATPIVILALGGLVIALIHSLSHDLDYRAMVSALRQLPAGAIGLSVGATVLSFVALIGREYCGLRYVGSRVPMTITADLPIFARRSRSRTGTASARRRTISTTRATA